MSTEGETIHTKKLRIFVGPGNTAGNAHYIARSLRSVGVKAKSYVYHAHEFGYPVDKEIIQLKSVRRKGAIKLVNNRFILRPVNAVIRFLFFISVLFRYDLFYFISPITFFENHLDLAVLKFFGKKVAFFFPGCAERNPHDDLNAMKYSDCWFCNDVGKQRYCLCHRPDEKRSRIEYFEKKADFIFSRPNTSGFLKNPEKALPMWLMTDPPGQPVDLSRYSGVGIWKIMHFPSHQELKGTRYVEAAIARLNGKYKIEYLSRRMTNREVLENLGKAHILVDQFTHTFGLLAIEGLSRGCVVICRMEEWARSCYPDIPVVSCNPEDLEETIDGLLADPERMQKIAEASVQWFRENASLQVVGKRMLNGFQTNSVLNKYFEHTD
jgi:glycosyltransferase involved in cell wall biosynthesis